MFRFLLSQSSHQSSFNLTLEKKRKWTRVPSHAFFVTGGFCEILNFPKRRCWTSILRPIPFLFLVKGNCMELRIGRYMKGKRVRFVQRVYALRGCFEVVSRKLTVPAVHRSTVVLKSSTGLSKPLMHYRINLKPSQSRVTTNLYPNFTRCNSDVQSPKLARQLRQRYSLRRQYFPA